MRDKIDLSEMALFIDKIHNLAHHSFQHIQHEGKRVTQQKQISFFRFSYYNVFQNIYESFIYHSKTYKMHNEHLKINITEGFWILYFKNQFHVKTVH